MKVVCIMCGLRQLAGAGTNWKFLLSPRPIKLRVNLAPLIIAAGASPSKKNLANGEKYIEQLRQIHVTTLTNLALLIIAAGASPLKRITPASYLPNSEDGVLLHQADYYFSHLRKRRARKSCQGHRRKDQNIVEGELAPHADLIHAMHIQLFRLQQKHTSNHFLSNSVLPWS